MKPTRLEVQMGFVENLIRVRKNLNYTQKEMADALDMKIDAYRKLERGEVERIDFYTAIMMYYLTGQFGYQQSGFDIPDGLTLARFCELSEHQKRYAAELIAFEYDFEKNTENAEDYITVFVPLGDMKDGMIYDTSNVFKMNVAKYRKKFGNLITCGLKITSNHLHPAYNYGDILLICQEPPRHGDIGIFINRNTQRVYIRKLYQSNPCRLEPITNFGTDIYVDGTNQEDMEQWIKFGYILAKVR